MARGKDKLTVVGIKRLGPGMHGDGAGLWLRKTQAETASWIFRYMLEGRAREMGLGAFPTVPLATAREKAKEQRQLLANDKDPIDTRDAVRLAARLERAKAMTFKQCAEAYIEAHRSGWRNAKHAEQWTATMESYAYPTLGDLPVALVDTALVMKVLKPIWTEIPETASRVRGRIERILAWATASSFRAGDNPARWRGHLDNLLPARAKVAKVKHHPALPYAELPGFMVELREQEGAPARALEFAILTAARTGEVIGAKWGEVEFDEKLWTIPAERMKAGKEHRVPLSAHAVKILERLKPEEAAQDAHVFVGGTQPLSNMAMLMLLRRMGRDGLTVHGFRSTFRDWCAERTSFPAEVAEMALAHTVSDKVEAAYRRGDLLAKRHALARQWATYCYTTGTGTVVTMQKRVRSGA